MATPEVHRSASEPAGTPSGVARAVGPPGPGWNDPPTLGPHSSAPGPAAGKVESVGGRELGKGSQGKDAVFSVLNAEPVSTYVRGGEYMCC